MAKAGQFRFPNDIAGRAPVNGNIRFSAGAVEPWSAPARLASAAASKAKASKQMANISRFMFGRGILHQ
jgi:hypothetical protein